MKSTLRIYHNARCSKSRETLCLIEEAGKDVEIVNYLKTPPTFAELKDLLVKLHLKPEDIVRKKEPLFLKKFKNKKFNDDEWITIMTENPVLIERPIVVKDNKAVLGRPPENVMQLIKK